MKRSQEIELLRRKKHDLEKKINLFGTNFILLIFHPTLIVTHYIELNLREYRRDNYFFFNPEFIWQIDWRFEIALLVINSLFLLLFIKFLFDIKKYHKRVKKIPLLYNSYITYDLNYFMNLVSPLALLQSSLLTFSYWLLGFPLSNQLIRKVKLALILTTIVIVTTSIYLIIYRRNKKTLKKYFSSLIIYSLIYLFMPIRWI